MRLVAASFPHAGYADVEVNKLYALLEIVQQESPQYQEMFAAAGDFNAEAGSCNERDDPRAVGKHGSNSENSRGQWSLQRLAITNIFSQSAMSIELHSLGQTAAQATR